MKSAMLGWAVALLCTLGVARDLSPIETKRCASAVRKLAADPLLPIVDQMNINAVKDWSGNHLNTQIFALMKQHMEEAGALPEELLRYSDEANRQVLAYYTDLLDLGADAFKSDSRTGLESLTPAAYNQVLRRFMLETAYRRRLKLAPTFFWYTEPQSDVESSKFLTQARTRRDVRIDPSRVEAWHRRVRQY